MSNLHTSLPDVTLIKNCVKLFAIFSFIFLTLSCKEKSDKGVEAEKEVVETADNDSNSFSVDPISHATAVINWDDITIYIDPVGGAAAFANYKLPDLILITDIHGDHFDLSTLDSLNTSRAKIIVPQAVADKMPEKFTPQLDVLSNGEEKERYGINVTAIPMYNLREEARQFHVKGRGNGYVMEKDELRVYFSGDTEDIPEMRSLKDIDKAFVCMNLPYTMTVEKAADAVAEFKPAQVYPYHYRGRPDVSDVQLFKELVNSNSPEVEVVIMDWYPGEAY